MRRLTLFVLLLVSSLQAETLISWKRLQLHGDFYSEGAGIGDINGDGKPDIVAGPFWWEGPSFEKKHAYYEPKIFNIVGYSDNFFAYVYDFNGDKKNDILIIGFPGKEARLYLNPGNAESDAPWEMHIVADVVDNESPVFTDITGDGKPEIVCNTGGKFGWFAPNWDKPTEKWAFVAVSPDMKVARFTHGLGVGDVNGDRKLDLMEAKRWWQQPAAPETSNSKAQIPNWQQHNAPPGIGGGAQMFAYDFDGDGVNDVASTLAAHNYGVAVYLQNKGPDEGSAAHWKRIMLAGEHPTDSDYGIVFSQPHAMYLADINGDGVMDLVTGKRYWAHNGHGPDEHTPLALYWFETKRDGKGGVDFVPHLVDADKGVGVGTDVQVGDLNGDKLPDILVANKAGVFVMLQERKEVSAAEAAQREPKKMYGPALKAQTEYAHGQSPQDALKAMQLPGGFKAELIAAEPDIVQPIAMTWDERGRLWVVEGMSYPQPRAPGAGKDRIKILEDKDGDGTFETVKTFCDGISLASGIEVGFGGVWVGAAPYFMFIPDRDRDDKPDSEDKSLESFPKVPGLNFTAYALLDGFGSQDTHETLNSFIWGPDGWLYGCHGVFTHSNVGKPGTPDDQRTPLNCGVWRYHPVRHTFEVFAQGTSNPWGLDYDQHGEFFVTACVIPHLYHIVPGARYQRQGGQHFNPYTYDDIKTIADHPHFAGDIRNNAHWGGRDAGAIVQDDTNAAGGGHAHCGLAIYQSSLFPQTFRNTLIFGNLHGHRLVTDYLDENKSTFTGKHGSDFMRSNDMNFIPVTQKVGPDGALYVSDWSDKQVCHRGSNAVELWDRSNGRIYRVSYAGWKPWKGDLSKEGDADLAKLAVQTENEWLSRMARRVLMERFAPVERETRVFALEQLFMDVISRRTATLPEKLRALWAMRCVEHPHRMDVHLMTDVIGADPALAPWVIRLLGFVEPGAPGEREFADPFGTWINLLDDFFSGPQPPAIVRELASLLQRMPVDERRLLAPPLLSRGEWKDDPYIPLLIWYGIEPLVGAEPKVGLELAKLSKIPKVTEFIYRRMGAEEAGRTGLLTIAGETSDPAVRDRIVASVLHAARAVKKVSLPEDWEKISKQILGDQATPRQTYLDIWELESLAGKKEAITKFANIWLYNLQEELPTRQRALQVVLQAGASEWLNELLSQMTSEAQPQPLRRQIIQGLASVPNARAAEVANDLRIDGALLTVIERKFSPEEVQDAVTTLTTWAEGAQTLLTAIKENKAPRNVITPFLARQMQALHNAKVDELLKETFGDLNAPKADLEERKKKFRPLLKAADLAKADATKGHAIFTAICGQCHKLFGEGQSVGPDLTGSNRGNLDYLLDNVLDPNAVIGKDYQLNLFELKDGRVASGVLKEESPAAYRIAMPGGLEQTITAAEVKTRTLAKVSTMPEGLFDALPVETLQQLVAYLQTNASPAKPQKKSAGPARKVAGALEGETLKVLNASGGKTKIQGMAGFGGRWSNGAQLWWTGGKPGNTLTLAVPVEKAGKFSLKAVLTKARDYGMIEASLDGEPIEAAKLDLFNTPQVIITDELDWGTHELAAGDHKLTVKLTGANPQAVKSYMFGLDYVRLEAK
jgi:putative membrane-bound dehydrogenase-like protein